MTQFKEILRAKQLCNKLHISRATLWRWVNSGNFPQPIQLGPNTVGWKSEQVQSWIDSRSHS